MLNFVLTLKKKLTTLTCQSTQVVKRLNNIQNSEQLLSDKYDSIMTSIHTTKKQVNDLFKWNEAHKEDLSKQRDSIYDIQVELDVMQQYSRKDCLELSGIPVLPADC